MKTTNEQLNDYNASINGRIILESSNSILVIHPYYDRGMWVFDDDRVGLSKEPFVAGADQFIEYGLHKMGWDKKYSLVNFGFWAGSEQFGSVYFFVRRLFPST